MPHNNRLSSSAALRTNDMWSKTIGHNPYAAGGEEERAKEQEREAATAEQVSILFYCR